MHALASFVECKILIKGGGMRSSCFMHLIFYDRLDPHSAFIFHLLMWRY